MREDEGAIVNIQVSEPSNRAVGTDEYHTIDVHSAMVDQNSQSEPEKCYPVQLGSLMNSDDRI